MREFYEQSVTAEESLRIRSAASGDSRKPDSRLLSSQVKSSQVDVDRRML